MSMFGCTQVSAVMEAYLHSKILKENDGESLVIGLLGFQAFSGDQKVR